MERDTIARASVTIERAKEALARIDSWIESVQSLGEPLQTEAAQMIGVSRALAFYSLGGWTSQEPESGRTLWREWKNAPPWAEFHNVQEAAYQDMVASLKAGGEEFTLTYSAEPDESRSRPSDSARTESWLGVLTNAESASDKAPSEESRPGTMTAGSDVPSIPVDYRVLTLNHSC